MSEISMNSNNLYAVQKRPVQTMPEAAKASFKGAPEPEEKEGWSTTAKVGAAVAVLGAAGLICYLTCGRGLPKDVAQAIKNALEGTSDLTNKSEESLREIIQNLGSAISKAEGAKVAADNADLKKMKETQEKAIAQLKKLIDDRNHAYMNAFNQAAKDAKIKDAVAAANKAIADCNSTRYSPGYGEVAVSKIDEVLAELTPEDAGYGYWKEMKNEYVEKSRQVKDLAERKEKILTIGYNEQTYEQDLKKVDSLIAEFKKFGLDDDVKFLKDVKERLISSDASRKQQYHGGNKALNEAADGTKDTVSEKVIAGQEKSAAEIVEKEVPGSGAAEKTVSEAVQEQTANAAEEQAVKTTEEQAAKAAEEQAPKAAKEQAPKAAEEPVAKTTEEQVAKVAEEQTKKASDTQPGEVLSNAVDDVAGTPDENTASFLDTLSLRAGEENFEKNVERVVPKNSKPVPEKVLTESSSTKATESLKVVKETESKALNNSKKNINENSIKVDDTTTPEVKPSDITPAAELQPSPQPSLSQFQRIWRIKECGAKRESLLALGCSNDAEKRELNLLDREIAFLSNQETEYVNSLSLKRPSFSKNTSVDGHRSFDGSNGRVRDAVEKYKNIESLEPKERNRVLDRMLDVAEDDKKFAALPPLENDCIVYRGMTENMSCDRKNVHFKIMENAKIGDIVVPDAGYSYTGATPGLALRYFSPNSDRKAMLYTIHLPKGSKVSRLDVGGGEVLMPRGAQYRVIDKEVSEDGRKLGVVLEYILPEAGVK